MNSEEIKKEILTKLEIEREVREQLKQKQEDSSPVKKTLWKWLESKFGLLIIGAVISGVLIPTFQFTQEEIKWRRQNRYDSLEQQRGSIRESLKQFIAVQALSAELYNLGLTILDAPPSGVDRKQFDQWRNDFRALQARRLQQNAAFAATIFYFPAGAQVPIRSAWNKLIQPSQKMETVVGKLLAEHKAGGGKPVTGGKSLKPKEVGDQLDEHLIEVNQSYERLLLMLRRQLVEVEHESAGFK